jgi:hypothetical protein
VLEDKGKREKERKRGKKRLVLPLTTSEFSPSLLFRFPSSFPISLRIRLRLQTAKVLLDFFGRKTALSDHYSVESGFELT